MVFRKSPSYLPGLLILSILCCCARFAHAQILSIQEAESRWKDLEGLEKLKALNLLTAHYQEANQRKALKYGRQAVTCGEVFFDYHTNHEEHYRLIEAYTQLGIALHHKGHYDDAEAKLQAAKLLSTELDDAIYLETITTYLAKNQAALEATAAKDGLLSKLGNLKVGEKIHNTATDIKIESELTLGFAKEKTKDYDKAVAHYKQAIQLLKEKGDAERTTKYQLKVATLLDSLERHSEGQALLNEAILKLEEEASDVLKGDDALELPKEKPPVVDYAAQRKRKSLKDLSEDYARKKDYKKSLAYYKLYQELSQKIETDSLKAVIEERRKSSEIFLLKQQKKIADLHVKNADIERDKQVRLRNISIALAGVILLATLGVFYFYWAKKRQHQQLSVAYDDLAKTKSKLETAEQRIVKLLSQQVSGDIAMKLIEGNAQTPVEKRFVCIMFLDIRGFTPTAEKLQPEELIAYQNRVFGFMIDIVEQYNGTVNQLLGDGFMATFGAPQSHGNDCQNAFLAAKKILANLQLKNESGVIPPTKIGIGLHAGDVVTGNVGTEARKQFSVTGNPVILASRIEQLNKTYNCQFILSEEVFNQLDDTQGLQADFKPVKVKGRSEPINIITVV